MQRKSVKSSNISAIGYDPETKTMEVEFMGGSVYHYSDVSQKHYDSFINAESIGSHFHKNIRGQFDFTKGTGRD